MTEPRITAPKVYQELCKHLDYHGNKLDPKLHNQNVILFGEQNDNGLVRSVREIEGDMKELQKRIDKYDENVSRILWLVGGTLIASVLNLILKLGA